MFGGGATSLILHSCRTFSGQLFGGGSPSSLSNCAERAPPHRSLTASSYICIYRTHSVSAFTPTRTSQDIAGHSVQQCMPARLLRDDREVAHDDVGLGRTGLISKLESGSNIYMQPPSLMRIMRFVALRYASLPALPFTAPFAPVACVSRPYLRSPMSSVRIAPGRSSPCSPRRAASPSLSSRTSPQQRAPPAHCSLLLLPELHSHAGGDLQVSSPAALHLYFLSPGCRRWRRYTPSSTLSPPRPRYRLRA